MKLAAIAAFVLVGLAVGQTIRPIPDTQVRLVGEIPAEWWTYVQLRSSQPFTVPGDHHFVVTTCIRVNGSVYVGGQLMDERLDITNPGTAQPFQGTRVVFPPGTVLETAGATQDPVVNLWGYLEPVR